MLSEGDVDQAEAREMNFSFGGAGFLAKPQACKPIQKKAVDKKTEEELAQERQRLKVQKLQTVEDWAKRFFDVYLKSSSDTGQEQKNRPGLDMQLPWCRKSDVLFPDVPQ